MAYPLRHLIAVLLASLLATAVTADDKITYPTANLTFNYLDTVDVSFVTDYDTPWLYLFCWDVNDDRQEILYYSPSDVTGHSVIAVKLQSNTQFTGTTCWFNLRPAQPANTSMDTVGVTSPEFSYVKEEADKKTFALSSTGSAASSATSTAKLTSASGTTATATNEAGTQESSAASGEGQSAGGLSGGAKAGIGIAVSLVGIGIIVAASFCIRRRRAAGAPIPGESWSNTPKSELAAVAFPDKLPHELPQGQQHYEMDSDPIIREPSMKVVDGLHEMPGGKF